MSKLKRKVTVDSDDRRKPSVFERLGPGATRRSYGNYDDSDSDRESAPKKCINWLREGDCPYGNKCKFQHGPFSGSKAKGRHEDSPEDLRLRVKRKEKAADKAGSDTDESEASRLRELDFKKELELEQQRQRIQRELSELDDQIEDNVRGRENFTIEKKIHSKLSKGSSSDSDSDRSRGRGHKNKKKKKKRKISKSPSKRSPSPDSDDHHKKHKKKAKGSGKKKRRESLEEIPKRMEPDSKGRKLLSPLKFKKSHKPMMSEKISAFHSEEEEEPQQAPPKSSRLQRSFSSSSDDLSRTQSSQKSKEKRSITPVKKKGKIPIVEYVKEVKRKHSKARERSISKGRERSRSSSVEDKKVKKLEKKKIKKEEYYERRKDVDFAQRPAIIERSEKDRDHTPMSDFRDFSPGPDVVKKKKEKKKDKKKKDRDLSIGREELERKHKKDKLKERERSPSPSSSRYSQKMEKRALDRGLEGRSRREIDPRVRSPAAKGLRDPYGDRRGKSPEMAYRDERSPAARYKDEVRKDRDPREAREREMRDPRDLSREGREPRDGRDPREGRDPRDSRDPRELRDRDPREGRDPRDPSRGREGDRLEFERDRNRERDYEYERRGREPDSRGRPPGPPGSYRDQPPGRGEYERGPPEGPPRGEPGQERRGDRYGDQRDPHYPPPPPGYEDRGGYNRDRYPKPGERGPYGRPDRPDMDRRDPGERYDRERFQGDLRGRGDPRFEGPMIGPRPPYEFRDPGWDRGRGRGGPPRPWGRGGPADRGRYDDRNRRPDYDRRDEFYVPERRDWPSRHEGEERREDRKDQPRPEDKDREPEKREERPDDREKDRKIETDEKKDEKERPKEEDREKREPADDEGRDRSSSRKRPASAEESSQSPISKRTREGSPALSTHSRKSAKSVRNLDREMEADRLSDKGSDRSRHRARSKGRDDRPKSDGEEGKETERRRSRSPERKRSRSRSVDGSFSGDSKRRKTDDKDIKEEGRLDGITDRPPEEKKEDDGEAGVGMDSMEQHFSDWSENDSDDDILNQPEQTPPPAAIPFERVVSPSRIDEASQQSRPSKEESGDGRKELVPGVPEQDVDDFESISSEESSLMGVVKTAAVDALEIDWASLLKDDRPKPTKGSALQRFKPGKLFAKLGLSKQYAGEELYKEVLSICQREEEADLGETTEPTTDTDKEKDGEKVPESEEQAEEKKEKKEQFEFKHDIAMFHSSALNKLKERRNLLSDIGPFRRALCARKDLEIRRQLCKVDKNWGDSQQSLVLDHTQVYPSQEIDPEVCKLSIQLFRQAKSGTEKQNIDTSLVSKEVTCA